MQNVLLKGHNDGYEITLKTTSSFENILKELQGIFAELKNGQLAAADQPVSFDILTGDRLLSTAEKKAIEAIIEKYPLFSIHRFAANVVSKLEAYEMVNKKSLHLDGSIIRNGQTKVIIGDVLFIGDLHQGGILQASGSVFLMGKSAGIIHAGFPNNPEAIIAGDFHQSQQIRISDAIAIISQEKLVADQETVAYVNDLHVLDYTKRSQIKQIRPKLFSKLGGQ
ncbi:septum site-determining protein MinC [Liquorilactobacillus sicerae]|uniref:septum site-determining protein MinC n=1 Tax=Liquorilactobacillus sicerae TaxID=1416943 RepID=UPI0024812D1C|nr:septum site-determining protein MinC [Liquorilactobacillus sicerae]